MDKATGMAVAGLAVAAMRLVAQDGMPESGGIFGIALRDIDGRDVPLEQYRGKVLLVVNVASRCGFTKQYADLETLHRRLQDRGFAVLGFPSNDFGGQEPGSEEEIKTFCTTTFGVTFPMFSKLRVKGDGQHPLYAWLTDKRQHPEFGGPVSWNFTKFLIGRDGRIAARFGSRTAPLDAELVAAVEKALGEGSSNDHP